MATGDLTTLPDVKTWLGLANVSTDDALLTRLVSALSAAIQSRINRTIASASYTETRNGSGMHALALTNTPVTAVASVTVDEVVIPARTTATGTGYVFDDHCVYLAGYCFSRGKQNVIVAYTGGYQTTPNDLAQAAIELVAFCYREKDRIGEAMKVLAQGNVSYVKDFPAHTLMAIDQYRRVIYP